MAEKEKMQKSSLQHTDMLVQPGSMQQRGLSPEEKQDFILASTDTQTR